MSSAIEFGAEARKLTIKRVSNESHASSKDFLEKVRIFQFAQAKKMLASNPQLKESLIALKVCDRFLEEKVARYCSSDSQLAVIMEDDEEDSSSHIDEAAPINKQQILLDLVKIGNFFCESGLNTNYCQLCLAGALLQLDERASLKEYLQTMTCYQNPHMRSPLMELDFMKAAYEFTPAYLQFFKPLAEEVEKFLKSEEASNISFSENYTRV
ncbi:MAG: hypothetical protein JSR57_01670 [Verrucomicrobia bacterium]|nr:hypothetical protein [Verrucomicrobiota bacterium]